MKKFLAGAALLALLAGPAHADPAAMVGLTFNFATGMDGLGVTAKVVSSDKQDQVVGAAGVSLFPFSDQLFGVDVGGGYNFNESSAILSYDLLRGAPSVSAGWVNTQEKSSTPTPP